VPSIARGGDSNDGHGSGRQQFLLHSLGPDLKIIELNGSVQAEKYLNRDRSQQKTKPSSLD
jgi:hypothetical protein